VRERESVSCGEFKRIERIGSGPIRAFKVPRCRVTVLEMMGQLMWDIYLFYLKCETVGVQLTPFQWKDETHSENTEQPCFLKAFPSSNENYWTVPEPPPFAHPFGWMSGTTLIINCISSSMNVILVHGTFSKGERRLIWVAGLCIHLQCDTSHWWIPHCLK